MNQIEKRRVNLSSSVFIDKNHGHAQSPYWPKALVIAPFSNINNSVTTACDIDESQAMLKDLAAKVIPKSSNSMVKIFTAITRGLRKQRVSEHD